MAFTCGFFNSQNGDRKYNAEQMASIFDGLIKDGVYDTVGEIFAVTPGTGMQVLVGSGRAWFDHTWNNNDASYPLAITAADVSLPRYDAVVLETNHSDTVRTNRLRVVTGTPASNPVKPTMASSANVKQHPLAYIKVTAGATAITQSMIQVVVGTSECPFVTGIIDTAQIDALFQQWNGEFNEWFENLKAQLSDNVVANLQAQIDKKVNKSDVATKADIEAGTSTTKWVSPKGLKDFSKDAGVYDVATNKMVNIVTDPSILVLNKDFPWYSVMASGYSAPIGFLKDRFVITGMKPVKVNSNTRYHPLVNIYDNDCHLLKTVEDDSYDYQDYGSGSISLPDPGEYKTVYFSIDTEDGVARYGAYYPHRNIVCFERSNFPFIPIETSQYCLGTAVSDQSLTIYYSNSPSDKSYLNTWPNFTVQFQNMSVQVVGAYGQYIYAGLYPKYAVAGSGKIAKVNISTKSIETTYDIPTLSGWTIDPKNSFALEYPYAYMAVYKSQNFYSKLLRVDLRNGNTNFNDVSASSILNNIGIGRMIGYDANYFYSYPSNNSTNIGFTRISKSTCSIEIFPSIISPYSNSIFHSIPLQTPTEPDYATLLTGLTMIDVQTLKWIPSTYIQDDTINDKDWIGNATAVASTNSLYVGHGYRASKRNLIYNPATSPYRYSDIVVIKE